MNKFTVEILVGLPGSGKSSYANEKYKASCESHYAFYTEYIDYENLQLKGLRHFKKDTLLKKLFWRLEDKKCKKDVFIYLDGLFLDLPYIQEVVARWREVGIENFKVIVFDAPVEVLLKNDKLRRTNSEWNGEEWVRKIESCEHTIRNKKIPAGLEQWARSATFSNGKQKHQNG